jgi:hypothetical protein
MATLRSRTQHPPGGFQVIIPQTGQKKATIGSFDFCVAYVMGVVRGNRALAEKYGWQPTREWAENYVEAQNVARLEANPRFHSFLTLEAELPPPPERYIPDGEEELAESKKNSVASVVGVGRNLASGIHILIDMLGSTGRPVEAAKAASRAAICVDCPQNSGGDWKAIFTKAAAEKIRQQLEIKHQMNLVTPHDAKLTVCEACDCPLQLKVWTPLHHIFNRTSPEQRAKLDPRCWILHEEQTPN